VSVFYFFFVFHLEVEFVSLLVECEAGVYDALFFPSVTSEEDFV